MWCAQRALPAGAARSECERGAEGGNGVRHLVAPAAPPPRAARAARLLAAARVREKLVRQRRALPAGSALCAAVRAAQLEYASEIESSPDEYCTVLKRQPHCELRTSIAVHMCCVVL